MAESREDRFSRIRAAVDDVRAIPPTDAAWLLEQIPDAYDIEYRVDRRLIPMKTGEPQQWIRWSGPWSDLRAARRALAYEAAQYPRHTFCLTRLARSVVHGHEAEDAS